VNWDCNQDAARRLKTEDRRPALFAPFASLAVKSFNREERKGREEMLVVSETFGTAARMLLDD
jgi:hypothetical protein